MKKPGDGCRDSPATRRRGEVPETPQPRTRDIGEDAGATLQQSGARGGGCVVPTRAPRPRLLGALFAGAPHGGGCGGRAPRGTALADKQSEALEECRHRFPHKKGV